MCVLTFVVVIVVVVVVVVVDSDPLAVSKLLLKAWLSLATQAQAQATYADEVTC